MVEHNELAEAYLRDLVINGACKRYNVESPDKLPKDVLERLDIEYKVIIPNKFTDYILMIWDIHDFCRNPKRVREFCGLHDITPPPDGIIPLGPGRGSAGGSMVCYCLGITQCDPLLFGLFFERFLNPERIAYPDIDFDISQRYRHIGLAYIADKYGAEHVSQIMTYGTLSKNLVVENVLKSAYVPNSVINMVKEQIPEDPSVVLSDIINPEKSGEPSKFIKALMSVEFPNNVFTIDKTNVNKVIENNKFGIENMQQVIEVMNGSISSATIEIKSTWTWQHALDCMLKLEGLTKNESVHAAGVVVAPVQLESNVPLMVGKNGGLVCQYEKQQVEDLGYLKMDALGLRTVDVNHEAERLVQKWYDPDFKLENIRYDDEKAIKIINDGDTAGIFQIEGTGFTQMMQDLDIGGFEVKRFADRDESVLSTIEKYRGLEIAQFMWISAGLALYRPGPLDAIIDGKTMVKHLCDRKAGKEPIAYLFPEEKNYLEETYGVLVYQEQVMSRVRQMTGCSYGRADILRKAMGKKDPVLMKEQMDWFRENAMQYNFSNDPLFNNISHKQKIVDRACEEIEKFARYGFNKAHTVEYGHICYHNAYLKAHYPDCFYTAIVNSLSDSPEKQTIMLRDMMNHGVELLPPDINESDVDFMMTDKMIVRFGLGSIKQFGDDAVECVIKDRIKNGKYKSVEEFRIRIPAKSLNKTVMTNLAKCGAFDTLIVNDFNNRADLVESMENLCKYVAKFTKKKNKDTPAPTPEEAMDKWINSSTSYTIVKGEDDPIQYSIWEKEILKYYISAHPIDRYEAEIRRWGAIENTDDDALPEEFYIAGFIEGCHETIVKKEGRNKGKKMGFLTIGTAYRIYEATMFPGIYESCLPYIKTGNPVILKGRKNIYKDKVTIQCEYIRNMASEGIRDCPECHIRLGQDDILSLMQLKQMFDEHFGTTKPFIHVIEGNDDVVIECAQTIALNDRIINFVESVGSLGYKDV